MAQQQNVVGKPPAMYLAFEDWSPRFETTFYSFKMESYELVTSLPPSSSTSDPPSLSLSSSLVEGKTNLPAYYYKIQVLCGHTRRTVLRRYSQFRWLYQQLPREITAATSSDQGEDLQQQQQQQQLPALVFPPPTWWCQPQNDAFAQNRLEQLEEFLRDALVRRGAATHDAVSAFLELEALPKS